MICRARILIVTVCFVLGGSQLRAGGVHIRYPVDAPEKLAHANEVYTDGMMHLYHHHPRWFEHEHPFFAAMFNNPAMMDRLIARWEAHEQRFEYWHDSLWRVLDAYVMRHKEPLPPIPLSLLPSSSAVSEAQGNGPGDGSRGGDFSPGSVPEPSTGILVISGLVAGLSHCAWRRIARRRRGGRCVAG